jgi:hypothetical protein
MQSNHRTLCICQRLDSENDNRLSSILIIINNMNLTKSACSMHYELFMAHGMWTGQ